MGSAHCPPACSLRLPVPFFSVTWCGGGPAKTRPLSPQSGLCIGRAGPAGARGWWGSQRRSPSGRRKWSKEEAPSVSRQSSQPPHLPLRRVQQSLTEPLQRSLQRNTRQLQNTVLTHACKKNKQKKTNTWFRKYQYSKCFFKKKRSLMKMNVFKACSYKCWSDRCRCPRMNTYLLLAFLK